MSKKAEKEPDLSFITRDDDKGNEGNHPLVTKLLKGQEIEMTAIGCIKLDPQVRASWIGYAVKFKGDKVTELVVTECDLKPIAENFVKVNVQQRLLDEDHL